MFKIVIKLYHIHIPTRLYHFLLRITDAHDFPQNTLCAIRSASDAAFLKRVFYFVSGTFSKWLTSIYEVLMHMHRP